MAILFDAKPAAQVPYLKKVIKKYKDKKEPKVFSSFMVGSLKSFVRNVKEVDYKPIEDWIDAAEKIGTTSFFLKSLRDPVKHTDRVTIIKGKNDQNVEIFSGGKFSTAAEQEFSKITSKLQDSYKSLSELKRLETFFNFESIYEIGYNYSKNEVIGPLIKRIEASLHSLEPIVDIVDSIDKRFKCLNIFSTC